MVKGILHRIQYLRKNIYLLGVLTEREIKSKYKASIIGLCWSFLNPLLYMVVLTLIFTFVIRIKIEKYPLFLLSGLLPWNFFSTTLSQTTNSIVANSSLIKKVYLPKELFPFSIILSNLLNFIFSLIVFVVLLVVFGINLKPFIICIFLPILLSFTLLFYAGISLIFSCLNVFFRDLTYIVGVILILWFYASPVLYPIEMVPTKYLNIYLILNPMASIIHSYREVLFYGRAIESKYLLFMFISSLMMFVIGYIVFTKYEDLFAEVI